MGKGEGKGGCFAEKFYDCCCDGVACLCFLLLAGPALIVVGIIFLARTANDDRSKRVSQFNDLTTPWNQYGYNDFQQNASFAVQFSFWGEQCQNNGRVQGTFKLRGDSFPLDPIGDDSKRVSFNEWKYSLELPRQVQNFRGFTDKDCYMRVWFLRIDPDGEVQTSVGRATTIGYGSGKLQIKDQKRVCYSKKHRYRCVRKCKEDYGGDYSRLTGQCTYTKTLSAVCVKVQESKRGHKDWKINDKIPGNGKGCFWDSGQFQKKDYKKKANVDDIEVFVRSVKDPYLNFQYVTDGSDSFGLTTGQKVKIGASCLGVGVLLISFWVLTIFCCFRYFGFCGERPEEPYKGPFGKFYHRAFNKYGYYIPGYQATTAPYPQKQSSEQYDYYQQDQTHAHTKPQYEYGQGGQPGYNGQPYGSPSPGYPAGAQEGIQYRYT